MTDLDTALQRIDVDCPSAALVIREYIAALESSIHDQRWQHAQELRRAEQAERERNALRDDARAWRNQFVSERCTHYQSERFFGYEEARMTAEHDANTFEDAFHKARERLSGDKND